MPKRQLEKSNWMRRNIGSYKAKEIEGPKKTAEWIAPQKAEFDRVGSNGLGAFGSCPIPDVNFLFIFFFFLTGPEGDNDCC